jgi:hypothetical protein
MRNEMGDIMKNEEWKGNRKNNAEWKEKPNKELG